MSGGNGSLGPGSFGSSYGSSGTFGFLRVFVFLRDCVAFLIVLSAGTLAASGGGAATAGAASTTTGGGAAAASTATAVAASGVAGVTLVFVLGAGAVVLADGAGGFDGALAASGAGADRPSTSMYVPAPASARSSSSTTTINPIRRFGGATGSESSLSFGRRCCDVGCTLCAAAAGAAPFVGAGVGACCAGWGLLGCRCTLGVSGNDAGGVRSTLGVRCDTGCAGFCTGCAPVSIFCVGGSGGVSRAPQPPQNRESGSFSVPQLGQRIPP